MQVLIEDRQVEALEKLSALSGMTPDQLVAAGLDDLFANVAQGLLLRLAGIK